MKAVGHALQLLTLALEEVKLSDVSRFIRDAHSFVTSFREAIELSAPHIYLSALAFAPKDSLVYQTFCPLLTGVPKIKSLSDRSGSIGPTIRGWTPSVGTAFDLPTDRYMGEVHVVAISCDGRFIASASTDCLVRVWSTRTRHQACLPLIGHKSLVSSVAFSADDQWIATGSRDGTVQLWNTQTREESVMLRAHMRGVTTISFSPDGLHLASGSHDGTIRVWKVAIGRSVKVPLIQCNQKIRTVAYSPSGRLITAIGSRGDVQSFDATTGRETGRFPVSGYSDISSSTFSPDGAQIATTSGMNVTVFNVETGCQVMKLRGHTSTVLAVAWSPDGQFLATGASDGTVRLWNSETQECIEPVLFGHTDSVSSVCFSSDGRFLVTGSWDKTVRLWRYKKIWSLADECGRTPLASLTLARYKGSWLVSSSGELLLWVPPEYHGRLAIDGHSRIIPNHGLSVAAQAGVLYQGEQWTRIHDAVVW